MKITDNMVLFWATNEVFSNWHPAEFEENGIRFANSEQWMMWCKAKRFGCNALAAKMLTVSNPRKLKDFGRQVTGYIEEVWEAERLRMMVRGCWLKFSQNPEMRDELLATGDRMLVEASPDDKVWGIFLGENDPRALDPAQWLGRNLLGIALMEVRRLLRAGEEAPALPWLLAA